MPSFDSHSELKKNSRAQKLRPKTHRSVDQSISHYKKISLTTNKLKNVEMTALRESSGVQFLCRKT